MAGITRYHDCSYWGNRGAFGRCLCGHARGTHVGWGDWCVKECKGARCGCVHYHPAEVSGRWGEVSGKCQVSGCGFPKMARID